MMSLTSIEELYIISYLIEESNEEKIVGYATLAGRLQYLVDKIREDEKIGDAVAESMDEFVEITDDGMLKWESLKNFLEGAKLDDTGSMFIDIRSEQKEPNKWTYRFESTAPKPVLERKIEDLSQRDEALKQKISNAAGASEQEVHNHLYK